MKMKLLGAIILSTASMHATADQAYWVDTAGSYHHDRKGDCWRTSEWTKATSKPECEGGVAKAAPAPVAAKPAPAPVAKPAPAPAPVVAAPKFTSLSLSSGATFKTGGSTLSAAGKAEVAALLAKFKGESIESVVVEGYTDDRGAASFNQQLSEKRAEAVKAEMVANGVDASKITTIGHGESNPIASNNTREGRAQNRRVEVKVDAKRRQM